MFGVIINPQDVKGIFVPKTQKQLCSVLNTKHRGDDKVLRLVTPTGDFVGFAVI